MFEPPARPKSYSELLRTFPAPTGPIAALFRLKVSRSLAKSCCDRSKIRPRPLHLWIPAAAVPALFQGPAVCSKMVASPLRTGPAEVCGPVQPAQDGKGTA